MQKGAECLPLYLSLCLQGIKSRSSRIALELGVNSRTRNPEDEDGNVPSKPREAITQPHGATTRKSCSLNKTDLVPMPSFCAMLFPVGDAIRFCITSAVSFSVVFLLPVALVTRVITRLVALWAACFGGGEGGFIGRC
jgi:hypothetical protein